MSREEWNEVYKKYPGDVVEHLLNRDDLLSKWAAVVIESLREENRERG